MSYPRFFVDGVSEAPGGVADSRHVVLSPADYHHIVHVARTRVGERVELVERGSWQAFEATVSTVGDQDITVGEVVPIAVSSAEVEIHLVFGLAKGDRSDTIVRQAVEVGVSSLAPALFKRSVVKLVGDKVRSRGDRLRKVAESAAKQSHRSSIPPLSDPAPLAESLNVLPSGTEIVVLWEEADGSLVETVQTLVSDGAVSLALVVGPEGGITADEVDAMRQRGAHVTGLGRTILRVDTACTVACAVALHTAEHALQDAGSKATTAEAPPTENAGSVDC